MRFAFIGTNSQAWPLLDAVYRSERHSLSTSLIEGELRQQLAEAAISVRLADNAEDIVAGQGAEIIVLALEDCDEILRLSRIASQGGRPIVVILPSLTASPALSFELQLLLDEAGTAILPVTGRWRLNDLVADRLNLELSAPDIHQVSLELPLLDSTERHLLQAVREGLDILTATGFRYSQVTCLDAASPDGTLLSRLITLNSQPEAENRLPPASLTLRPARFASESTLRVVTGSGEVMSLPVTAPNWLSRIEVFSQQHALCSVALDDCSATLELAEAVAKSIRRRRTVDVHFDAGTERSVFKSQMTAIGCGVLSWLMLGMVAYLIAGQLLTLPDWVWYTARILWMLPLVLFLGAQLLLPLTRDRGGDGRRAQRG